MKFLFNYFLLSFSSRLSATDPASVNKTKSHRYCRHAQGIFRIESIFRLKMILLKFIGAFPQVLQQERMVESLILILVNRVIPVYRAAIGMVTKVAAYEWINDPKQTIRTYNFSFTSLRQSVNIHFSRFFIHFLNVWRHIRTPHTFPERFVVHDFDFSRI